MFIMDCLGINREGILTIGGVSVRISRKIGILYI